MPADENKVRPKVDYEQWQDLKTTVKGEEGIDYTNAELLDKILEIVKNHYEVEN
jgi:hypothetical protein